MAVWVKIALWKKFGHPSELEGTAEDAVLIWNGKYCVDDVVGYACACSRKQIQDSCENVLAAVQLDGKMHAGRKTRW